MNVEYWTITLEENEFAARFPEIAARADLNKSDKLRLALGLAPRRAKAGAPEGNKNAVGNKGRWQKNQTSG